MHTPVLALFTSVAPETVLCCSYKAEAPIPPNPVIIRKRVHGRFPLVLQTPGRDRGALSNCRPIPALG